MFSPPQDYIKKVTWLYYKYDLLYVQNKIISVCKRSKFRNFLRIKFINNLKLRE